MSSIMVNTSQLRSKAEELRSQNAHLKSQIQLLDETEQSLNAMWDGDANTAFHNAFQSDKSQFDNFYTAINRYIETLQLTAQRWDEVEQRNADTAISRKY